MFEDEYINWLYNAVCDSSYTRNLSYYKLFDFLYSTDFYWSIAKDENRAIDGIHLRYDFADMYGLSEQEVYNIFGDKPCSVLEMMVALANRCEEAIACDEDYGNRRSQWFWTMLVNIGLSSYSDRRFDLSEVERATSIFLNREYNDNEVGCPFHIENPRAPLNQTELWMQLNWYLAEVL